MPISASYDPRLVVLSFVIASLASFVALDLAGRTTAARLHARLAWLAGGSCVMGVGIWSMHFIGMLAFGLRRGHESMPIAYHMPEMSGSVLVAIAASALALGVASRPGLTTRGLLAAGVLMGGAIAGMHYLGMAAMRMGAVLSYSMPLVAASIGIAVVASIVALALARRLGETHTASERWAKRAAAAVMGVAIAGMHYTGMAAARFAAPVAAMPTDSGAVIATSGLAISVTVAAVVVLLVGLLGVKLDRQHGQHLAERMEAGEARYRTLTESATDAIVSADASGTIIFWNAAAEETFDYPAAEVIGQPLTMLTPSSRVATSLESLRRATADRGMRPRRRTIDLEGIRRDQSIFPMEVSASEWADGSERTFTAIIRDISHRRLTEAALRESERRFRDVVEQSPEAIVLHAGGTVLYANPAAASLIGVPVAMTLAGRSFAELLHPDSRARWSSNADNGERTATVGFQMLHADDHVLDVEARSVPATFNGEPAVQTHLRDVTEQKTLEAQLAHQAFHDSLTDLANRALFRDRVDHALTQSGRRGGGPAVLFLDLDNFKAVNDGLGHSAGDDLLCIIARRLNSVMRPSDTCARLGGDEFAILIEEPVESTSVLSAAARVAQRVIAAFQAGCAVGGTDVVVTVSVGIAVAAVDDTAEDLLRNADVAMYRAKASGKGRYAVFEPAMHEIVRKRLELETDLRRAVEACERGDTAESTQPFVLYFQPIACLRTGDIRGFEALVRWQHAGRGLVPPLDFIPIAEDTGLIIPLGRWIMQEACRRAGRWQRDGVNGADASRVGVTVNLSARQLMQPELTQDVASALASGGLAPGQLTIEVTESMLVDDSDATLGRLHALKALGVRLAIDDFGTGYSSLRYLERFPVDLLKIDRTFVETIGTVGGESRLARAILGLGRELGMEVVAEGIETEAQCARLDALGCEFGQGYFLARPLPASELRLDPRCGTAMPTGAVVV